MSSEQKKTTQKTDPANAKTKTDTADPTTEESKHLTPPGSETKPEPYKDVLEYYKGLLPTDIYKDFLANKKTPEDKLDFYQKNALARLTALRTEGIFKPPPPSAVNPDAAVETEPSKIDGDKIYITNT